MASSDDLRGQLDALNSRRATIEAQIEQTRASIHRRGLRPEYVAGLVLLAAGAWWLFASGRAGLILLLAGVIAGLLAGLDVYRTRGARAQLETLSAELAHVQSQISALQQALFRQRRY